MYLGALLWQEEEMGPRWVGVSGAYYDDRFDVWVSAPLPNYINVSGTYVDTRLNPHVLDTPPSMQYGEPVNALPLLIPRSEPKSSGGLFIRIMSVKPPFSLREDGVYIGKIKITDRVIPIL